MLRRGFYEKVVSRTMLFAFCVVTIFFQNANLNNYYTKIQQGYSLVNSCGGQLGLSDEESQTLPTITLEEEDDEFRAEFTFLDSLHCDHLIQQFLFLQEQLFKEHHPEIFSPPPQG